MFTPRIISELNTYIKETSSNITDVMKHTTTTYPNLSLSYEKITKDGDVMYVIIRFVNGSDYSDDQCKLSDVEKECRSICALYQDKKLEMIYSHADYVRVNNDAEQYITDNKITDLQCEYCYEGTLFTIFWCDIQQKWRFHTRSCLDANFSSWHEQFPYGELIVKSFAKNKIILPNLEKKSKNTLFEKGYTYTLVLIDSLNKNIISYAKQFKDNNYSKILFISKRKFGSMTSEKVPEKVITSHNMLTNIVYDFTDLKSAKEKVQEMNTQSMTENVIHEGVIMRAFDKAREHEVVLKLQTTKYIEIKKIKPNVSHPVVMYLELYQKNNLKKFLEYYNANNIIVKHINTAFTVLSNELLHIYHNTIHDKHKQIPEDHITIYKLLPASFRTAMYHIHGVYIERRKKTTEPTTETFVTETIVSEKKNKIVIRNHDISNYLRQIDGYGLRSLFLDRAQLIQLLIEPETVNNAYAVGTLRNIIKIECYDTNKLTQMLR